MNTPVPTPPSLPRLRPKQEAALVVLFAGGTDGDAATAAGVRRETVCRWRHADADFIAELNRRRTEGWSAAQHALRSLLPKAVTAIGDALDDPSPSTRLRAASLLLKTLAVGDEPLRPPMGPADPAKVREQWEAARKSEEESAAFEQMFASLRLLG